MLSVSKQFYEEAEEIPDVCEEFRYTSIPDLQKPLVHGPRRCPQKTNSLPNPSPLLSEALKS